MSKIKLTIVILWSLLNTQALKAQDEDKTVTLVVSGQGKTQDEAKQNALRSAIEQAFGAFISSKTEILNDNLVKDEIVSLTNGNIIFNTNPSGVATERIRILSNGNIGINQTAPSFRLGYYR
jgi:hypothetical protein